mgnify:CR=1 FL=1
MFFVFYVELRCFQNIFFPCFLKERRKSFQELSTRLPIRLRGFGLRSFAETAPVAFIGGIEKALGGDEAQQDWWRTLLESGTRTGDEYRACWEELQTEGEQIESVQSIDAR